MITVAGLLKELTKKGIESNLEGLIEQYNQNIEDNKGDSRQNQAIRKIFGIGKSKSMQFDELMPLFEENEEENHRNTEIKKRKKVVKISSNN